MTQFVHDDWIPLHRRLLRLRRNTETHQTYGHSSKHSYIFPGHFPSEDL
jgi:hypothetical protein